MRLSVTVASTAVLLAFAASSLITPVSAEEKYKSRPQPPDNGERYKRPGADHPPAPHPMYKPPEDRPANQPPPTKDHADKRPPEARDDPDPHDPPPTGDGWPVLPPPNCPPHSCPQPIDEGSWDEVPIPDPGSSSAPLPMDMNSILVRRTYAMRLEGFSGEVIVAWNGSVQFGAAFDAGEYIDIGSMAESFTAYAGYRLVEAGRLAPGTTLGQLFANVPPDKRDITIAQLLGHTGGLGNTHAADGEGDRSVAVAKLLAQPLTVAPGRLFLHSDDGYALLAAAIEVASGMPYERYLRQSDAISPGMTSTIFRSELGPGAADWGRAGTAGVLCTARDLYSWASRFAPGTDYIAAEIMRPRDRTANGVGIGLGWSSADDANGTVHWSQGTSDSDDNAIVVVYPTSMTLVVTSKRYYGGVPWSERVANSLEPFLREWAPGRPLLTSSAGK